MPSIYGPLNILLFLCAVYGETDWCDPKLCRNGHKHVKCGDDGSFGPKCTAGAKLIEITPEMKASLLHEHNKFRSQTAQGQLENIDSAVRMLQLSWHDELQQVAEALVRLCVMAHDGCRNTEEFSYSGQNLAWTINPITSELNESEDIVARVERWFLEHRDTSMKHINKFPSSLAALMRIGHYTCLSLDHAAHVGCAASEFIKDKKEKIILVACNYDCTNMMGSPVFKSGPACSECKTGCSVEYPGLCCSEEVL